MTPARAPVSPGREVLDTRSLASSPAKGRDPLCVAEFWEYNGAKDFRTERRPPIILPEGQVV